jgi:hypothetical protein
VDVLGYHGYSAAATWLVSGTTEAPRPAASTPDWSVAYAYNRWQPTFWATASMTTSFLSGPPTEQGTPTAATLRERQFEAGVLLPIRHVRVSHSAVAALLTSADEYTLTTGPLSRRRSAVRGGWATTSAHTYGYSISPEGGVTVGVTAESNARALGSDARATTFTADGRFYLPGVAAHHVVAVRAAAGVSSGDADIRRTFHLGGPYSSTSVLDFDRDAISLLRGFPSDTFAGSHVALVNGDYRFPIVRPQRGAGTWPLLLHTLHASVFIDAGHAWTRTFDASAIKTSVGAELSANVVAGYVFPFTIAVGVARGHDGSHTVADRSTAYVRVGRAF